MKKLTTKDIILIEDHHQAYYVWKARRLKNLALIHIDAHIDFTFQQIKDARLIIEEAKSLSELKNQLEKTILFKQKQFDIEKLTHIGNYIYPAIRDGIVQDFYWVIPGDKQEFTRCMKNLKSMIKGLAKQDPKPKTVIKIKDGILKTHLYGQNFIICCLKALPKINKKALLDIDTDFLVINSIRKSRNTDEIGRRKIWIEPEEFIRVLKAKVRYPVLVTIAYSVNGGYTTLKFKYLGDEIASGLKGKTFKLPPAAKAFNLFNYFWQKNNKKKARYYYRGAIKSDPTYAVADNNYGPLYLARRFYKAAEDEFRKILYCEPQNKDALCGMGQLYLRKQKYKSAERYFRKALKILSDYPKALFGLGCAQFKLKKYKSAEKYLLRYQAKEPMQPHSHYLLGQIYEKKKQFVKAIAEYRDALRLGLNDPVTYLRLLRLAKYSTQGKEIIQDIRIKFKRFKQDFLKRQKPYLARQGKTKAIKRMERKFALIAILIYSKK
jgi:tetratricopeptide (TPR) repeat protein